MTITEFLEARIAEDEKVATEATRGGDGQWWVAGEHEMEECVVEGDTFKIYDEGGHDAWQAEHIARHDPARVLAECAAKRAIIAVITGWAHDYNDYDMWYSCGLAISLWGDEPGEPGSGCADESKHGECTCGLERRQMAIFKPLAAVYASHPDYRQEWAL